MKKNTLQNSGSIDKNDSHFLVNAILNAKDGWCRGIKENEVGQFFKRNSDYDAYYYR